MKYTAYRCKNGYLTAKELAKSAETEELRDKYEAMAKTWMSRWKATDAY
jgi:hypothetical protein